MRSKLVIILLLMLFLSCGNDDSSKSNTIGTLVGQWQITQRTIDGNVNPLEECEPFSVYTYFIDGTYSELHYAADIGTNCIDNPTVEFTGTWQKNSEFVYTFTNADNVTSEVVIQFDSNSSFTTISSGISNPIDPIVSTIAERFIRIE